MIDWTPELEDHFLESVLPADDDLHYQRALVEFDATHGKKEEGMTPFGASLKAIATGNQWLRRKCIEKFPYDGPFGWRTRRDGMEFTYAELRILTWVIDPPKSERKSGVPLEYVARFLQRSVEEVKTQIDKMTNERHGIRPFF